MGRTWWQVEAYNSGTYIGDSQNVICILVINGTYTCRSRANDFFYTCKRDLQTVCKVVKSRIPHSRTIESRTELLGQGIYNSFFIYAVRNAHQTIAFERFGMICKKIQITEAGKTTDRTQIKICKPVLRIFAGTPSDSAASCLCSPAAGSGFDRLGS